MNITDLIFWILAAAILGSGLAVVSARNLVHAALFMVLTFFGISGIYVLLEADFLAVVQILIYVGAIAVLIIFGVMLTQRENMEETNVSSPHRAVAAAILGVFLALMILAINSTVWLIDPSPALPTTVGPIAELMLSSFVIPFEAAAILLTVAILGAIILSKGARRAS
ncbi:MAG: NADH-quinone oxidoreductase subunit J [Syntrophomonadaceae bacterium]|nr:NADH-quinone oxidoreductase subunit J [Syntrophomonadaceae bacterium]